MGSTVQTLKLPHGLDGCLVYELHVGIFHQGLAPGFDCDSVWHSIKVPARPLCSLCWYPVADAVEVGCSTFARYLFPSLICSLVRLRQEAVVGVDDNCLLGLYEPMNNIMSSRSSSFKCLTRIQYRYQASLFRHFSRDMSMRSNSPNSA